jgi:hypothetical protein
MGAKRKGRGKDPSKRSWGNRNPSWATENLGNIKSHLEIVNRLSVGG